MFISVQARRLRPEATHEDFVRAWYPESGFGVPMRGPILARDVGDDRGLLTLAFVDLPDRASLERGLARVAAQEAVRHERLDGVIASTGLRAIYEVTAEFDFSSDETVARGRPPGSA